MILEQSLVTKFENIVYYLIIYIYSSNVSKICHSKSLTNKKIGMENSGSMQWSKQCCRLSSGKYGIESSLNNWGIVSNFIMISLVEWLIDGSKLALLPGSRHRKAPRAGFEPAQYLRCDFVEWNYPGVVLCFNYQYETFTGYWQFWNTVYNDKDLLALKPQNYIVIYNVY